MIFKFCINDDMKNVMCVGDSKICDVLCLLLVVMKQKEVDECIDFDDVGVFVVIERVLKQCKDLIIQYFVVGCQDLVDVEQVEVDVFFVYMLQ